MLALPWSMLVMLASCTGSEPQGSRRDETGDGDAAGSHDSGSTDDTAIGPFDECGWAELSEAVEARRVAERVVESFSGAVGELALFATEDELSSWWQAAGLGEAPTGIQFGEEQAFAVVTAFSGSCGQGVRVVGVRQGVPTASLFAGLEFTPACDDTCDDALPYAQLWAAPLGELTSCSFEAACR